MGLNINLYFLFYCLSMLTILIGHGNYFGHILWTSPQVVECLNCDPILTVLGQVVYNQGGLLTEKNCIFVNIIHLYLARCVCRFHCFILEC